MSSRRRKNVINLVSVSGAVIEGVQQIRSAVYTHFSTHFKESGEGRLLEQRVFHK